MKQVFRRVIDRRGRVSVLDLPVPHLGPDQVLVQGHYSLISSGTETGTLSKTPTELVKQTISDPWMRHVVKQTVFATGLSQTARRVGRGKIKPPGSADRAAGAVLVLVGNNEGVALGPARALLATGP